MIRGWFIQAICGNLGGGSVLVLLGHFLGDLWSWFPHGKKKEFPVGISIYDMSLLCWYMIMGIWSCFYIFQYDMSLFLLKNMPSLERSYGIRHGIRWPYHLISFYRLNFWRVSWLNHSVGRRSEHESLPEITTKTSQPLNQELYPLVN